MNGVGWIRSAVLTAWIAALAVLSGCGSSGAGERDTDRPPEDADAPAVLATSRPVTVGALTVRSARILEAAADARTSVYAEIENTGPPDRLASIRSEAAAAGSLHHMRNEDGYMLMEPVPGVDVPAGGRLVLQPGAFHGMLESLERPLVPGDSVRIVFGFASGTAVEVVAPVLSLRDLVASPGGL